jgi:Ni/Co efflux regulator RcnB
MSRVRIRILAVAAIFALAVPALAVAQDHDHDRDHRQVQPHPHPGGPPPGAKPFVQPRGPFPGGAMGPHPGPAVVIGHPGGPPGDHFSYRGHMVERIHINPFVYPQGWAYRRWEVGAALPPIFLAREYWYADWAALGMAPPPPGFEWVRYGPDLLLVDVNSGQVADVAYDVFY